MNFSFILDAWSIFLFVIICLISVFVYRKCTCRHKVAHIADFTSFASLAVTLGLLMYFLSDLTNLDLVGKGISFVILTNFYASVFNVICKIYASTIEKKD